MNAHELDVRWHRNYEASQRRLALKERAIAYLGGKCQICGYDRCPAAFDFHHIDAREKDFSISESLSWDRLRPELDKCVLLCATCHREVHNGWHSGYLEYDEGGKEMGEDPYDLNFEDDEDTDVQLKPSWSAPGF